MEKLNWLNTDRKFLDDIPKIGIQLRIRQRHQVSPGGQWMVRSLANSSPSVRSVAYHQPLTMCTCGRRIAIILFFPGPIIMWFPVSYRAPDTGRFLISSRDPALAFLPAASFLPSSSTSAAGLCPQRRCLRGSLLRWLTKDNSSLLLLSGTTSI